MTPQANKDLIRRYYEEMWNRWDLALADKLVSQAIRFRGSLGTTVEGIDGFKSYVLTVRDAFPDFHNTIEALVAEEERVAARLTYTDTHRRTLFGIPPLGKRVAYAGAAFFWVREGTISEGSDRGANEP